MKILKLFLCFWLNHSSSFIIPNEIPTILSVIYSNIPPVRIGKIAVESGFDTRFGIGFRIGPHADYQALVEIGPQTNTNSISTNGTLVRRQSLPFGRLERRQNEASKRMSVVRKSQETKTDQEKSLKTTVGNIEFNRVPGIDEELPKIKRKNLKITKNNAEMLPSPVQISLL